ncbi:MAG: hypothetical protein ACKOWF_10660, partial [Chloroflexota bacterium]
INVPGRWIEGLGPHWCGRVVGGQQGEPGACGDGFYPPCPRSAEHRFPSIPGDRQTTCESVVD